MRVVYSAGGLEIEGIRACTLTATGDGASIGPHHSPFARWALNGSLLRLETDRFGFYPMFYTCDPNGIAVSASLTTLLRNGTPTTLDDAALAVFLRLGFFIGEDTAFKAIRVAPPNADIRWSPAAFEQAGGYWLPKPQPLSRAVALRSYVEAFREAVKRLAPDGGRWALPLSGGCDSRHILFALCEIAHPPMECVTARHYPPRADELALASAVAAAIGVPHVTVEQLKPRVTSEAIKNALTHYGTLEHAWTLTLMEHFAGRYDGIYDGIAGDILSAGLYLDERKLRLFEQERLVELSHVVLGDEGYLPRLLPAEAYRRFSRELAVERLSAELRRHLSAANPVTSFYFWNRTRRGVALSPYAVLNRACSVLTPYLDPDVYELLAGLPADLLLDHNFHIDAVAHAYPQFAGLPYENKQKLGVYNDRWHRALARSLCRYALASPSAELVRRQFIYSTAVRSIADSRSAAGVVSFLPELVYLLQLSAIIDTSAWS